MISNYNKYTYHKHHLSSIFRTFSRDINDSRNTLRKLSECELRRL